MTQIDFSYKYIQNALLLLIKKVGALSTYIIMFFIIFIFSVQTIFAEPSNNLQDKNHSSSFSKGASFYSFAIGYSEDYKKKIGPISHFKITINHYVQDNFALTYGLSMGYAKPKDTKNGFQGGPHLGFRKHFINYKRWSIYFDGSAGAVSHQYPLEEGSLRFNFELEAGCGFTYKINNNSELLGGFRHYHLSNARIAGDERNVGYDAPMLYLGIMRSF